MNEQISTIETKRIVANPNNPRTRIEDVSDLVASIRENGLMQPIIVRWTKKKDKQGLPTGYEVIAGSRRLTACQQLGIKKINCIVIACNDDKAFELATVENLVRENMTPADEARAVAKLFKEGKGRIEVGAIFGKSGRWAEGRRRIANLGEKALKMLEEGKINLGHCEALCLCNEDRLEQWLDTARYRKPEELKRDILVRDRRMLQNAPFNYKSVCKNCPKRSDCQRDLFGDVEEAYCLDIDCYEKKIDKECNRLEKEFKKAGYEEVPEDDESSARYGWDPYISASTEDEDERDQIKEWKKKGAKAMYWIDRRTAESGLAFRDPNYVDDEKDECENENCEFNYNQKERIRELANKEEREHLYANVQKHMTGFDDKQIAFILTVFTDRIFRFTEVDADGNEIECEETPLLHVGEEFEMTEGEKKTQYDMLLDVIVNRLMYYDGVGELSRETFGLKERSYYEERAKSTVREEIKSEKAENETED
ncbi:ParB/RepB/Spo0J family partition protein [Fibrobacter sp.]|uniref:ParB/RepB/Spo0J family partition protein n=1 Tax=Fibrobacter sp. TaxID=35828 RepID=UPI0038904913